MTSAEFYHLSLEDKAEVLCKIGTYLHGIHYYRRRTNLYSFGNLFVETTLDTVTNDITEIAIINDSALEKYLNRIKLVL